MYNKARTISATIASGGTTTDVIPLLGGVAAGIITPAALTSVTFTFTVCDTATGTFVPLYDSAGNLVSITVTTSRAYGITGAEADALAPWAFIKIVGNAAEAAARTIVVVKK